MQGWSFWSCFPCGEKSNTVVNPKPIPISASKIQLQSDAGQKKYFFSNSSNISLIQSFDEEKSKTATTITFRTTDTAPSKFQDDDEYIHAKVQQLNKKDLAEKKAIEQQFVKQNLSKSKIIYLVEKQWSEEYTRYLKDPKIKTIRPIDNKGLLDSKGKLRSDIKEKEDYFIINQRIWKFVTMMYGGGPDIARDFYFPVHSITSKKYEISPCGIKNPLNYCYMIAILQALMSIQHLNYYFYKRQFSTQDTSKKKPFHSILYKFIKQIIDDPKPLQDIKEFASGFESKFNPYEQHDAQEFFLHLVNALQQEMKTQTNSPKNFKDAESAYFCYMNTNVSIVDRVFAGQVSSTVLCKLCNEESVTYLPFIDICVQLSDGTLEGCLKKHFETQKLDDLYDCEKCKKKSKASKKMTLTKSPNYLMIVLKKFTPSGKKIQDRIKYPYELDTKKFSQGHCGQTKFTLLSVIVHKGQKSNKGHYYCYTRRNKKDWFYCNDEEFKSIDQGQSLGRDAYMLLYERAK